MGGIKDYAILLVMKEDFVTNDMILSPYVRISRKFGFFLNIIKAPRKIFRGAR